MSLTQSWRFGPAVASEANLWLAVLGDDLRITGAPGRSSRLAPLATPDAVLCRTNAGAVRTVMEAHDAGRKPALVGGGGEIMRLAEAAQRLQAGQPSGHPELVAFDTWGAVVDYARNDPAGTDLAIAVKLLGRFGAKEVIAAIGGAIPEAYADLVVSTVHKAKGREWDEVRVGADFGGPTERDGEAGRVSSAEAMLGYVAVTRARLVLDTGGLAWVHDYAAHHGIQPDPPPAAERAEAPPSSPERRPRVEANEPGRQPPEQPLPAGAERATGPVTAGPAHVLAQVGLTLGMQARVDGERGLWRLVGFSADGSVSAVGGPCGHWRSFMPEWCLPAERSGKGREPPARPRRRAARDAGGVAGRAQRGRHGCRCRRPTPSVTEPDRRDRMLPDDFPVPPHVVTVAWQAVQGDVLLPVDYANWLGGSLSILVAAVHHPELLAAQQPDTDARGVATEVLGELAELHLAARTADRQQSPEPEPPTARPHLAMQSDGQHVRISPGSELLNLGLNLEIFAKAVLRPASEDARTARGATAYAAAAWSKELGLVTGALSAAERRRDATSVGLEPAAAPEARSAHPSP